MHAMPSDSGHRRRPWPDHRNGIAFGPKLSHTAIPSSLTGEILLNSPQATVYIIDDEAQVCTGLSRLVRSAGLQAQIFTDARDFLAHVPTDGVGCILLDINMPGMSGPELHAHLGEMNLSFPVIYLTGVGNVPLTVQAMKRGALDFLEKPVDGDQLLAAIDKAIAVHRQRFEHDGRLAGMQARLDSLSAREREVLGHVIAGRLNKQIAYDLGIAEKTVKVHRGRVMTKVGARSLAHLVHMCDELGIESPAADPKS